MKIVYCSKSTAIGNNKNLISRLMILFWLTLVFGFISFTYNYYEDANAIRFACNTDNIEHLWYPLLILIELKHS